MTKTIEKTTQKRKIDDKQSITETHKTKRQATEQTHTGTQINPRRYTTAYIQVPRND